MPVVFTSNFKRNTRSCYRLKTKGFNLGNSIEDYTLPSLNLFPKVHKLKKKASMENESLLTARPIITGYGWCTVEASKYLQKRFRSIWLGLRDT